MQPMAWIYLGGLWFIFAFLYRDYRIDRTRFQLFRLRQQLFEFAAEGNINFDSIAYQRLRLMLNGNIRFAHVYNLTMFSMILISLRKMRSFRVMREQEWNQAVSELNDSQRTFISSIHSKMHVTVWEQICATSALLWITVLPIVLAHYIFRIPMLAAARAKAMFGDKIVHSMTQRMDFAALMNASDDLLRAVVDKIKGEPVPG